MKSMSRNHIQQTATYDDEMEREDMITFEEFSPKSKVHEKLNNLENLLGDRHEVIEKMSDEEEQARLQYERNTNSNQDDLVMSESTSQNHSPEIQSRERRISSIDFESQIHSFKYDDDAGFDNFSLEKDNYY